MFDTIHLKSPLVCPTCGAHQHAYQTHAFDDVMADYRIGSVVGGNVLTGIVHEQFWCYECYQAGKDGEEPAKQSESPVYIVVWHSMLVGLEQDLTRAEARLSAVDRLDLVGWLDEAQRNEDQWRGRFYRLLGDVKRWRDHLAEQKNPEPVPDAETPEEANRHKALKSFFSLPDEILSSPDPLAAIIEKNTPDESERRRGGFLD